MKIDETSTLSLSLSLSLYLSLSLSLSLFLAPSLSLLGRWKSSRSIALLFLCDLYALDPSSHAVHIPRSAYSGSSCKVNLLDCGWQS